MGNALPNYTIYRLTFDGAGNVYGLKGVYRSANANPAGPWKLVANATTLANANSAECLSGEAPGTQAWYNETLAVDPAKDSHVFVGLEEVYETPNAGGTWSTRRQQHGLAAGR